MLQEATVMGLSTMPCHPTHVLSSQVRPTCQTTTSVDVAKAPALKIAEATVPVSPCSCVVSGRARQVRDCLLARMGRLTIGTSGPTTV